MRNVGGGIGKACRDGDGEGLFALDGVVGEA